MKNWHVDSEWETQRKRSSHKEESTSRAEVRNLQKAAPNPQTFYKCQAQTTAEPLGERRRKKNRALQHCSEQARQRKEALPRLWRKRKSKTQEARTLKVPCRCIPSIPAVSKDNVMKCSLITSPWVKIAPIHRCGAQQEVDGILKRGDKQSLTKGPLTKK